MRKSTLLLSLFLFATAILFTGCGQKKALEDGKYQVTVTMEGGTGKAYIESPAELEMKDGKAIVKFIWSSKNYDYMIVDETKYMNEAELGNPSEFTIPLGAEFKLGEAFEVIGDTTAMSTPHEVTYQVTLELVK